MLFTDCFRTDSSIKKNRESEFSFLDRSARPEMGRVREFLEELAREYPKDEQPELIARIRSGSDVHFRSSIFELVLHGYLTRQDYKLTPHPELPNGSKAKPDFHVIAPSGEDFYLEAVLASVNDGADPAAEARIGTTLDALAGAKHPNFLVAIDHEGTPRTQPSGKRLLSAVLKWLDSLDPDEVQAAVDKLGYDAWPALNWVHEDWRVIVRAIPVTREKRGKMRGLIGVLEGNAGFIDEWSPIRDAIKFKGAKYGDLEKPLVVAVNLRAFHLDRIDEMQALFGQEQIVFRKEGPDLKPEFGRAANGAWMGKAGPQATRVSGAWLFGDLSAYSLAALCHTIYFNPWAKYPLPEELRELPHASASGGEMQWSAGPSLGNVFGLAEGWPEID